MDFVKPQTVDINDNIQLSDECRECNVTEENVREARSLEQVRFEDIPSKDRRRTVDRIMSSLFMRFQS